MAREVTRSFVAKTICIKTYQARLDAEIAKSVLEAAGIPAFVTADDYGGWNPIKLGGLWVRLLVNELDASKTLEVLNNYYDANQTDDATFTEDMEDTDDFPQQDEQRVDKEEKSFAKGCGWLAVVVLIVISLAVYIRMADNKKYKKNLSTNYINSAYLKRSKGDYDGAIADLDKAVELGLEMGIIFNNRAAVKADKGDYDCAVTDYNRALELYLSAGDNQGIAAAYTGRAFAKYYKGDNTGALADSNEAIRLNPLLGIAFGVRGAVKAEKEDYSSAIDDLTRATELLEFSDPLGAAWAYEILIGIMYVTNCPNYALRYATHALNLCQRVGNIKGIVNMYIDRAGIKQGIGDYEGALADNNESIKLGPTSSYAYSGRAFTYAKGFREFDNAIRDCNEAIRLDAGNARAYSTRGYSYAALGQFDRAFSDCEESIKLEKENGWNWYKYASVFALMHDKAKMIEKLRKAIELDKIIKKESRRDEDFEPYLQNPDFNKLTNP
jgi:tetratricopeptide (TPR) repeat protein